MYRIARDAIGVSGRTDPVLVGVGNHVVGGTVKRDVACNGRSVAGRVEPEADLLGDRISGELNEERIGIADIVKAADEGDEFARLMLERTGTYVGTAIANVINLLNLETIVVGGEITGAKDVVIEAITNRAKELSFARAFAQTTILAGTVGDGAPAIGAALIARPTS